MKQLDKSHYKVYTIYIRLYSDLKYYVKDVSQMKNVLKKIAAAAMAFTLIGTGSAISANTNSTLKAKAYIPPQYCRHNSGWHWGSTYSTSWTEGGYYATRVIYSKICNSCGSPL